jgi:hypothetical protein
LRIGEAYQIADDRHDLEQCLSTGLMQRDRMVALMPALLYFVGEMQPQILQGLEEIHLDNVTKERLHEALGNMDAEIDRRLRIAVSEAQMDLSQNPFGDLAGRAPWELMDMVLGR